MLKKLLNNKISKTIIICMLIIFNTLNITSISTKIEDEIKIESIKPEQKISDELKKEIETGSELISVYFWFNDIDQNAVDKAVYEKTSLTEENIKQNYLSLELFTESLISDNINDDEKLAIQLQKNIEATAEKRELERQLTDEYVTIRREICRNQYIKLSNNILSELNISFKSVIFQSEYTPMIIANLTPIQILSISENQKIYDIGLYTEEEWEELNDIVDHTILNDMQYRQLKSNSKMKDTMNINAIQLKGTNVKIGFYETGVVNRTYCIENYNTDYGVNYYQNNTFKVDENYEDSAHNTWCVAVACGDYGVAPEAKYYSAGNSQKGGTIYNGSLTQYNGKVARYVCFEWLITNGVNIINVSTGDSRGTDYYTLVEKYFDFLIANHSVIIVVSAGNNDTECIITPALSYNCITVNGFTDKGTTNINDDRMIDYSYLNEYGCFKPDVVAPSNIRTGLTNGFGGGTSTSAPVISGMIALLYQYKPSLATTPHLTKAILLASVHQKVDGVNEFMSEGLTERQGAGVPDMLKMIEIVAQGTYGFGLISNVPGSKITIQNYQLYNIPPKITISLAYLRENTGTVLNGTSNIGALYNLNLRLCKENSYPTNISGHFNSSTELIYTSLSPTSNYYKIEIYNNNLQQNGTVSDIRYAYAWSLS